jgi:polysaccharide export outer membrane protein
LAIGIASIGLMGCAAAPNPPIAAEGSLVNAYGAKQPPFASQDELDALEGPLPSAYLLGPGDDISVTVWGHPELSGKHVVGPDGAIQLSIAGSIQVGDLTADEAGDKLTHALSEDYVKPVTTVSIDSYNSNQVVVLGRVPNPGAIHFSDQPTLLEALARAGSFGASSGGAKQEHLTRCAIFRGRNRVIWVDLQPLLKGRDPYLNMRLRPNDVVYVPDSADQLVYVMGQVTKPGAYEFTPDMSLLDALAQAGGPNDNGQPDRIVLARPSQHLRQVINLHTLIKGNGEYNFALKQGDIIYVPKNGIASVGYVLQQLNPITQTALFGAAIF